MKKPCIIKDCFNPHKAHGWCSKHYMRFRKHGDPNINLRPDMGKFPHCTTIGCKEKVNGMTKCKKHYGRLKAKKSKEI